MKKQQMNMAQDGFLLQERVNNLNFQVIINIYNDKKFDYGRKKTYEF